MIRAIAIDPGTSETGWAVMTLQDEIKLQDFGTIRPKRTLDRLHKCIETGLKIYHVVSTMAAINPGRLFVLIEEFEGVVRPGRSANAMKVFGASTACAVGAAMGQPFHENIIAVPVKDWNPRHLKPEQVQAEASLKYGQKFNEHEAAAVSIGEWWLSVKRVELMGEMK